MDRQWTPGECEFLESAWGFMSATDIGRAINRTRLAVIGKADRLNLERLATTNALDQDGENQRRPYLWEHTTAGRRILREEASQMKRCGDPLCGSIVNVKGVSYVRIGDRLFCNNACSQAWLSQNDALIVTADPFRLKTFKDKTRDITKITNGG